MHDPVIEPSEGTPSADCQLHAVLVRVFDTGVLLLGDSGTGKSECALELITRGHRLCADDAVEIFAREDSLVGRAPAITRNLLEVRGLGIINVRELFGEGAVCSESRIDLCIELRRSVEDTSVENEPPVLTVAGIIVPVYVLPVSSGNNLATLVETAVRMYCSTAERRTAEGLVEEHARLVHPVQ